MNAIHRTIPIGFDFICEAPTGPMTATDKKIRRNTTTACVEILTDYEKAVLDYRLTAT